MNTNTDCLFYRLSRGERMALAIKAVFQPLQVVMETSGIGNRHVHVHVLPVYSLYDRVPREVQEQQEAYTPAEEDLVKVAQGLAGYLATHPS